MMFEIGVTICAAIVGIFASVLAWAVIILIVALLGRLADRIWRPLYPYE